MDKHDNKEQSMRSADVVDQILKELSNAQSTAKQTDDSEVDKIMAELGMGGGSVLDEIMGNALASAPAPQVQTPDVPVENTFSTAVPDLPTYEQDEAEPAFAPVESVDSAAAEMAAQQENSAFEAPAQSGLESGAQQEVKEDTTVFTLPRVGKAAAMDKVQAGKYSSDTELLSWFQGGESEEEEKPRKKRRERKKAERQSKKTGFFELEDDGTEAEWKNDAPKVNYETASIDLGEIAEVMQQKNADAPPEMQAEYSVAQQAQEYRTEENVYAGHEHPQEAVPYASGEQKYSAAAQESLFDFDGEAPLPANENVNDFTGAEVIEEEAVYTAQQNESDASAQAFEVENAGEEAYVHAEGAQEFAEEAYEQAESTDGLEQGAFDEAGGETRSFDVPQKKKRSTKVFDVVDEAKNGKIPTAAYTQEFETDEAAAPVKKAVKSLYVDDMVDEKFVDFFTETAIMDAEAIKQQLKPKARKRPRTALLTDEFTQLAKLAGMQEDEDFDSEDELFDDYNRPQDAAQIEADINALKKSLTVRSVITGAISLLLLWLSVAFAGKGAIPAFVSPITSPLTFGVVYLVLIIAAIAVNFSTVASGLAGLAREVTVDTPVALAALGGLLQGVVILVDMAALHLSEAAVLGAVQALSPVTLFGFFAGLLLTFNSIGKYMRAKTIGENFKNTSAGLNQYAAYVLDGSSDIAYNITKGLNEDAPVVLVNRPTTVVKGFMRQSFSRRKSDFLGRTIGWILLCAALVCSVAVYFRSNNILFAMSSFAAILCIGTPLSSTLLSAVPSILMQRSAAKVGAVIPGWAGVQELGDVNVVMATAKDIFPPSALQLHSIKTFDQERVDLAIQYAASVINEGCDTLRELFMEVVDGKTEMLYKVENLVFEPGRGFTAWVNNNRVIVGNREMLQKQDIAPPPVEMELKHTARGSAPLYLAISGKLTAMFIIGYNANPEVNATLESFAGSGVSLLVVSEDMNVTDELIEEVYHVAPGVIKVLSNRECEMLEPLTEYLPASDGVMAHLGSFSSFIGGMRAAAGCAAAENLGGIVQTVSVVLATLLCILLAISGDLPSLSFSIIALYHIAWTVIISILPLSRKY